MPIAIVFLSDREESSTKKEGAGGFYISYVAKARSSESPKPVPARRDACCTNAETTRERDLRADSRKSRKDSFLLFAHLFFCLLLFVFSYLIPSPFLPSSFSFLPAVSRDPSERLLRGVLSIKISFRDQIAHTDASFFLSFSTNLQHRRVIPSRRSSVAISNSIG